MNNSATPKIGALTLSGEEVSLLPKPPCAIHHAAFLRLAATTQTADVATLYPKTVTACVGRATATLATALHNTELSI